MARARAAHHHRDLRERHRTRRTKHRGADVDVSDGVTGIDRPVATIRLYLYGVTSRKGFFSTLRLGGWGFPLPKRPEPTLGDAFVRMPVVVPGQMDVVPWQRGQML